MGAATAILTAVSTLAWGPDNYRFDKGAEQ